MLFLYLCVFLISGFIQVRAAVEEFKYAEGQTDRQTDMGPFYKRH